MLIGFEDTYNTIGTDEYLAVGLSRPMDKPTIGQAFLVDSSKSRPVDHCCCGGGGTRKTYTNQLNSNAYGKYMRIIGLRYIINRKRKKQTYIGNARFISINIAKKGESYGFERISYIYTPNTYRYSIYLL
jgi:hypothetical protein